MPTLYSIVPQATLGSLGTGEMRLLALVVMVMVSLVSHLCMGYQTCPYLLAQRCTTSQISHWKCSMD